MKPPEGLDLTQHVGCYVELWNGNIYGPVKLEGDAIYHVKCGPVYLTREGCIHGDNRDNDYNVRRVFTQVYPELP